jgi:SOS response regulatory protein OraA/RecX
MATVSNEAYMAMLAELAAKKRDELAATYGDDTSRRLEAFLAQRGFTFDEINQAIKNIAGK